MKGLLLVVGMAVAALPSIASGATEGGRNPAAGIDTPRITQADKEPQNWLAHGRTYGEQRFSALARINDKNVKDLGLAWYFDTNARRGLEATPIIVDGVMYTTGAWSVVFALDARTGKLLWEFDPEVPKAHGAKGCCDAVNRGVAVYDGKVFVGAFDGRLIALDAATGKRVWETLTVDPEKPYTITGAPRVVKGKVIIGNGGAEFGVRGYVGAYDAATGRQLWRFYTVPGDPSKPFESEALRKAAATWKGEWWKGAGGGGTVWDSMAYDPELDLLYIGVGNGSPWNRELRSPGGGDNLFLSSIVALKPDTGEYVWHYQTTPGETWDYTATQHMILADLKIGGETRKVLMQAPKNGFFYVLDRATGKLIAAKPYVYVNWATHVDPASGRPVETEKQYREKEKITFPSAYGGHNWHPMAFNPNTGLVYIPAMEMPLLYKQPAGFKYHPQTWNTGVDAVAAMPPPGMDQILDRKLAASLAKGHLSAWDPVQQKEIWRVQYTGPWNGGVLSTAGNLVFQGTADGRFAAYRADTGAKLWDAPTQTGIIAPPVTYEIGGEQYVAVMAGWGGAFALVAGGAAQFAKFGPNGRLLVYKLGGAARLPAFEAPKRKLEPPALTADDATIKKGHALYHTYCVMCHGATAISGSLLPDLRYMTPATHAAFDSIVLKGAYRSAGMPSFEQLLSKADADAIHAYISKRAHDQVEEDRGGFWLAIKKFAYSIVAWVLKTLISLTT
jgi:PQQ-dependent dehydrogenase (methanol/ethanol family)